MPATSLVCGPGEPGRADGQGRGRSIAPEPLLGGASFASGLDRLPGSGSGRRTRGRDWEAQATRSVIRIAFVDGLQSSATRYVTRVISLFNALKEW